MNTELLNAINSIVEVTKNDLIFISKEAAETMSQFYLDNGGNGVMTGPYYEEGEANKFYYVEK